MIMVKNLKTKIQDFARGKYSVFWDLFDAINESVWDYFWKKTQENQTMTQLLHSWTMDNLLDLWTKDGILNAYDEKDFSKLAEEQAVSVFEKYNMLVEDKTKDEEYFLELKQKLQLKLQSKKAHDSRFFAYYVHHFKYYFFGACVVGGIGIFAFLLGFLTINRVPKFFSNPKVLTMTWNQAFGVFSGVSSIVRLDEQQSLLTPNHTESYTQLAKENFPTLLKDIPVARRKKSFDTDLKGLMKILNLPDLRWDKFADKELKTITLGSWAMNISLDLEKWKLAMNYQVWTRLHAKGSFSTSESVIKKKIRNQIFDLGLSLEQYGQIRIEKQVNNELIVAFIPRLFNGKLIYDEKGQMEGLNIRYHLNAGQIISLDNYSFSSWEVSKYPLLNQENLIKKAIKIWLYPQGMALNMKKLGKGEVVYQYKGDFLIPMIRRNLEGNQFFLSLVEEK